MDYTRNWEMCGKITVKANTLNEAMDIARDEASEIPLPSESYYVDGSWRLSFNDADVIRCFYNNEQEDEGDK